MTFLARPVAGAHAANDEASDVRWIALAELRLHDIHPTIRCQIDDHLSGAGPRFD